MAQRSAVIVDALARRAIFETRAPSPLTWSLLTGAGNRGIGGPARLSGARVPQAK